MYADILSYCEGSRRKYGRFVQDGLEAGYASPWKKLYGQVVLGDEAFWDLAKAYTFARADFGTWRKCILSPGSDLGT